MTIGRTKPIKVWCYPSQWEHVSAQAVADGSRAQMENLFEMAIQDLLALYDAIQSEITPWIESRPIDESIKFRFRREP